MKLTHELIEAAVGGHESPAEGVWRFTWRGVDGHLREVEPGRFDLVCDGYLVGQASTLFTFVDLLGSALERAAFGRAKKQLVEAAKRL